MSVKQQIGKAAKLSNPSDPADSGARQVMDATAMTFDGDSFHLAVDKGTLDAMMSPGTNELAGATWTEF